MRLVGVALVAVLLAGLSRDARAEVFHDAEVPEPGTVTLGFEGQFEFDPGTNQRVWLHAGVALFNGGDLEAKVAVLNRDENIFGGEFRYGLLPNGDGYPALLVYVGGHWVDVLHAGEKDYGGSQEGLTVSETIFEQSWYVGYDVRSDYIPELERIVFHQHVVVGVKIPAAEHLNFYVEGGYGIHQGPYDGRDPRVTRSYVSGGVTLFF